MKKINLSLIVFFAFGFCSFVLAGDLPGKNLFYNSKGKFGSCNSCHTGGRTAGRWNSTTQEIDSEEGRIIPSLKGISKRKDSDQIEHSVRMMKKMFGFQFTEEQILQLVEYVETL